MKINLTKDETMRYANGLEYKGTIGWIKDSAKCCKNVGVYKLYAERSNGALPTTKYYVANTVTGEVEVTGEHVFAVKDDLIYLLGERNKA